MEVLQLLAEGKAIPTIALELLMSRSTVKTHLLKMYDKLGVRCRSRAVAAGFEWGLLLTDRDRDRANHDQDTFRAGYQAGRAAAGEVAERALQAGLAAAGEAMERALKEARDA
jgi:DNA-binding CsgD family transcriptional regulator